MMIYYNVMVILAFILTQKTLKYINTHAMGYHIR